MSVVLPAPLGPKQTDGFAAQVAAQVLQNLPAAE
jgi:hypothetical protein